MATTRKTSTKTTRSKSTGTTRKTRSTAAKPTTARAVASKTTSSRTKTTARLSAAKTTAEQATKPHVAAVTRPDPLDVTTALPAVVTRKALFDRVKSRADQVKGRDVRVVIDAVLEELGDAISAGETVKIPPLGVLKVQRRKDVANGEVVMCKLRRRKATPTPKDPLAEAAE